MKEISVRMGFDAHAHFRDGEMLARVLPHTVRWCHAAIAMPNLVPPVRTREDALAYRNRIRDATPAGKAFTPLMTCYLTDETDPADVRLGYAGNRPEDRAWVAVKLYPAHATTNSAAGVTDIAKTFRVLEMMERIGMPLLLHGEQLVRAGARVDVFDRERVFIEDTLTGLMERFPNLRIVLEHVSTAYGAFFVRSHYEKGRPIAATITPHHLVWTRTDLFEGGMRPDRWCLPVVKAEKDRRALRMAATSGLPCFFMGTDTAPHPKGKKHCECAAGGIFAAPTALSVYAQVFEEEGVLAEPDGVFMFERFVALLGGAFYGIAPSEKEITLVKEEWRAPEWEDDVKIFKGGETLPWRIAE